MSKADDVLTSLDWDAPIECQGVGHTAGEAGHEPERPAEYRIRVRACMETPEQHDTSPTAIVPVCRGYAMRLRMIANHTMKCPECGKDTTIASLMKVLGPIAFDPEKSVH